MSLASDYVPVDGKFSPPPRTGERQRWSKMRSNEGSEASAPASPSKGSGEFRMVYNRARSDGSFQDVDSPTRGDFKEGRAPTKRIGEDSAGESPSRGSFRDSPTQGNFKEGRSPTKRNFEDSAGESPSRSSFRESPSSPNSPVLSSRSPRPRNDHHEHEAQRAMNNVDLRRIIEAVGKDCIDNQGDLKKSLHMLRRNEYGEVLRSDLRRWFSEHRVATRMADRFFDQINERDGYHDQWQHAGNDRSDRRNSDCIRYSCIKDVFKSVIGGHLAKSDSDVSTVHDHHHHHHHYHNVHGLLRPQHHQSSILSIPNADEHHQELTKQKLTKIAAQMTGKQQQRYVDKYGNIERQELQHLFESYGLSPDQSNQLFNSMDKNRTGEIKFKDLNSHLAKFLHCESEHKRKQSQPYSPPFDKDVMFQIGDFVGHKAGAKHKTVQMAFRFVDRDIDNKVDRFEVRNFFRNYGSNTKFADRFFDTLDAKRNGKIDFDEFREKFAAYIQPGYHPSREDDAKMEGFQKVAWAKSHYDAYVYQPNHQALWRGNSLPDAGSKNVNKAHRDLPSRCQFRRTSDIWSAASGSHRASMLEHDEIYNNRFGRFEGTSTYQSSYNPIAYGHHEPPYASEGVARFCAFQGTSTYMSSYNPISYGHHHM